MRIRIWLIFIFGQRKTGAELGHNKGRRWKANRKSLIIYSRETDVGGRGVDRDRDVSRWVEIVEKLEIKVERKISKIRCIKGVPFFSLR